MAAIRAPWISVEIGRTRLEAAIVNLRRAQRIEKRNTPQRLAQTECERVAHSPTSEARPHRCATAVCAALQFVDDRKRRTAWGLSPGTLPLSPDWNRAHPGVVSATSREDGMIKQVFAGVVVIGSVSGVASAQTYISMSPPPAAFVPPLVVDVNPPTTTTTAASSRNSDQREVTIQNVVNGKGNTSVEKDLLAGSP